MAYCHIIIINIRLALWAENFFLSLSVDVVLWVGVENELVCQMQEYLDQHVWMKVPRLAVVGVCLGNSLFCCHNQLSFSVFCMLICLLFLHAYLLNNVLLFIQLYSVIFCKTFYEFLNLLQEHLTRHVSNIK